MPNKKELNLDFMRRSGHILGTILKYACEELVKPGVTTLSISKDIEKLILDYKDSTPAFLGYRGFPEAACISVNQEIVHAIPSDNVLVSGDIVSIDCGVIYKGHYSDACRTVGVGEIGVRERKLLKTTKDSLDKGIAVAVADSRIGDISFAIQHHVERKGFNASRLFVGHGIGYRLHEDPQVPNCGPPGKGLKLKVGQCLAIEPVVFDGPVDSVMASDNWTVITTNGNLSAHFEDTIIIQDGAAEVLTRI